MFWVFYMKFYIYSLGCKVNSYESNVMKDDLINAGFIYSNVDEADIVIINSCTVTNSADNKTMKLIRHVRNNYDVILVVVGCFVQSKKDDLSIIPGDILLGNKNKSVVSNYINRFLIDRNRIEDMYDVSNAKKVLPTSTSKEVGSFYELLVSQLDDELLYDSPEYRNQATNDAFYILNQVMY